MQMKLPRIPVVSLLACQSLTLFWIRLQCASNQPPACSLHSYRNLNYYKEGDLMIGGIVQMHMILFQDPNIGKLGGCGLPSFRYLRHAMALIYATEEINRNPNILPNITLGYQIYDSCLSQAKALQGTLSILSKQTEPVPNYSCQRKGTLVGIIGDLSSATSFSMAQLISIYKYPQISFGALDPLFSDKARFPSFYRTVPNELSQYSGIAQLLKHFGWSWVGILTSDDDSGERALRELKREITLIGGCVEFSHMIPTEFSETGDEKVESMILAMRKTTARVIILYSSGISITEYILAYSWSQLPTKIWITSVAMTFVTDFGFGLALKKLNGTLAFSIRRREMIGFKNFLHAVSPSRFPDDQALRYLWQDKFQCYIKRAEFMNIDSTSRKGFCSGNETLKSLDSTTYDVANFRFSHSVYTAVYALAHALHEMLLSDPAEAPESAAECLKNAKKTWKLNRFLQSIHFKTPAGDDFTFDENGDVPAQYDILNWVYLPNETIKSIPVGTFDPSTSASHQLVINTSAILWPSRDSNPDQIPLSTCSESCLPGYRKAPIEGKPICCFNCVPCAEGEYTNRSDMENCLKCPDHQWLNRKKDACINKSTVFLSYCDVLGASLASIAVVLAIVTATVLGIFFRHQDTPIVRANNRNLSYGILISLMLSFLCSLLFIGRPVTWTCLTRQPAFGIIFTAAVSCVLAKTFTVIIAFNATKPGSRFGRLLGSRVSGSMVILCTLGEVVICLSWLFTSPPHPSTDMKSEMGKIILQCDEGSTFAFHAVIGYMGLLAFGSFFLAFLGQDLPDRFNESKLITFSMLVFCSVWVSFIPAYLSTKGRYMVAVEVFAIMASSAGLLACIFFPKCYIILVRPDLNSREQLEKKYTTLA